MTHISDIWVSLELCSPNLVQAEDPNLTEEGIEHPFNETELVIGRYEESISVKRRKGYGIMMNVSSIFSGVSLYL